LRCARLLPRACPAKPVVLTVALILAGCGGGGAEKPPQVLRGNGFTFAAPAGWDVKRTARTVAAEDGDVDRVQVTTFRLVKPYRPVLFAAAAKELDRVAEQLATQLKGRLVARSTVTAGGRKARSYRIDLDGTSQEITFVLRGRDEFQLLCRRDDDGDGAACRQLVRTFALR
jgi:hypothetical protein